MVEPAKPSLKKAPARKPKVAAPKPVAAKADATPVVKAAAVAPKPAVKVAPKPVAKTSTEKAPVAAKPKVVAKAAPKVAPKPAPVAKVAPPAPVAAPAPAITETWPLPEPVKAEPASPSPEPVAAEASPVPAPVPVAAATIAEPIVDTPKPELQIDDLVETVTHVAEEAIDQASVFFTTPQILEGNQIMNEAIETTKKFAEETKARVESVIADLNAKAKETMEKSSKVFEEMNDIAKGNLEAVVESSKIAAKGMEALGQSAAEYGRTSFEKTSATLKSFASVKSPAEFFQLQSKLFTSTFDEIASESAKASESFIKLAGDIAQPISSRAALVTDKIKALAA